MKTSIDLSPDDPRLEGWYHTIELGNGLTTKGDLDLRPTTHVLPKSLEGKTALDVGTANGFWAFEMEDRGADVTAIDVENWEDFDTLPWIHLGPGKTEPQFEFARTMRGSRVKRKVCNVYDLSPDLGMFDFVFCGSLLMHLQNPLKALVNIRSVTTEQATIMTLLDQDIEELHPDRPWARFGHRYPDLEKGQLGSACIYWAFNTTGLVEAMEYAGFETTEAKEPVQMFPPDGKCAVVVGYP